jgi:hypothetical protein
LLYLDSCTWNDENTHSGSALIMSVKAVF